MWCLMPKFWCVRGWVAYSFRMGLGWTVCTHLSHISVQESAGMFEVLLGKGRVMADLAVQTETFSRAKHLLLVCIDSEITGKDRTVLGKGIQSPNPKRYEANTVIFLFHR